MDDGVIKKVLLIVGSGYTPLADRIGQQLQLAVAPIHPTQFPNGERWVQLPLEVEGKDVCLFQDTTQDPNDSLFELLQMVDAAKQGKARSILVICPSYAYARQEHPLPRCAPTPLLFARLLSTLGADRLLTVDLHAPHQSHQFAIPTQVIGVEGVFIPYLRSVMETGSLLFGADGSMYERVKAWAQALGCPYGWAHKQRDVQGRLSLVDWHGDVQGQSVYLVDDRVDTGGTIALVAARLKQLGAKKITAVVTHGITDVAVWKRIQGCGVDAIIESDTRSVCTLGTCQTVLSVSPLITDAIRTALGSLSRVLGR
ncbi:MAG: ribose-phosphate diphosphokinase [Opitutales bacterium]|nr:ribose-phosphate diphosphokinase [Opitutales bacterium]